MKYHITIKDICHSHQIEESFLIALHEYELIELIFFNHERYMHQEQLPILERMVRLHQDLGINVEGLEAIQQLLDRVSQLQEELHSLHRKLNRFEGF